MKKKYENKYHDVEERNWWFLARHDMIQLLLQKEKVTKKSKILDIGCSGGALIRKLNKKGYKVTGCDLSKNAIKLCKKRGIKDAVCGDAIKLPFPDDHFDTIIASDILEHVKDDSKALKEWSRVLKKGGSIIMFVPAFKSLWTQHDVANMHYRRYSKKMLISKIKKSSLKISRISYWNTALFFPVYIMRMFKKTQKRSKKKSTGDLYELNPIINKTLLTALKVENRILKTINLPVGISLFAVLRKSRQSKNKREA